MMGGTNGPAWLFVPATRPDRVLRASQVADVTVIDCEDAVAPRERGRARKSLATLAENLDVEAAVVRVNAPGTDDLTDDLSAVTRAGFTSVMVPKAEEPELLARLAPLRVVALCETPRGILAAAALAAVPNVIGLMWGSVDLAAVLGVAPWRGAPQEPGLPDVLAHARWQVLLAARANHVLAIDHAVVELDAMDGVAADARLAARSGYDAKACIHPRQVAVVRDAFTPSPEQLAWAGAVVSTGDTGAQRHDGQLVDEAVRQQALRILDRQRRSVSRN